MKTIITALIVLSLMFTLNTFAGEECMRKITVSDSVSYKNFDEMLSENKFVGFKDGGCRYAIINDSGNPAKIAISIDDSDHVFPIEYIKSLNGEFFSFETKIDLLEWMKGSTLYGSNDTIVSGNVSDLPPNFKWPTQLTYFYCKPFFVNGRNVFSKRVLNMIGKEVIFSDTPLDRPHRGILKGFILDVYPALFVDENGKTWEYVAEKRFYEEEKKTDDIPELIPKNYFNDNNIISGELSSEQVDNIIKKWKEYKERIKNIK